MAIHSFICDICDITIQDTTAKDVHKCPNCNSDMRWDIAGIGIPEGDYYHVSDSLAVHPDRIAEHRKLFPNIEITSEGQPCFTSVRQQEKYAEKCGFYKKEQKRKSRGKRIA